MQQLVLNDTSMTTTTRRQPRAHSLLAALDVQDDGKAAPTCRLNTGSAWTSALSSSPEWMASTIARVWRSLKR